VRIVPIRTDDSVIATVTVFADGEVQMMRGNEPFWSPK
jgi:hypothetical protein